MEYLILLMKTQKKIIAINMQQRISEVKQMAKFDNTWRATALSIFPDMFPGSLGMSLAGQGLINGAWSLNTLDIRTFATDKHNTIDSPPFGGGPGMVMRPDIIDHALQSAKTTSPDVPVVYLSPRGQTFIQAKAQELALGPGVILLCGRFEGLDQRIIDTHEIEEISMGDFVLSGGEPGAITLLDACVRLLPGVMGKAESLEQESFANGLLEYPHYTRPQVWNGLSVPDVLTSGHHENIRVWRQAQSEEITKRRRPDLWSRYADMP
jgi:tRNA (guanine37-N1)-methyltransferase